MKKIISTIVVLLTLIPTPALAVRLYTSGFEQQSVTNGEELTTVVTPFAVDTTTKHSGAASLRTNGSIATTATAEIDQGFTAFATGYIRRYFYITAMTNDANVALYFDVYLTASNTVSIQCVYNGSTYTCTVWYNNFGASLPTTFTITAGAWHYMELKYDTSPADGSEVLEVKLDGSVASTANNLTITNKTINLATAGIYNGTAGAVTDNDVYFDDWAINNSTAGGQTGYPGAGNIVMLVPTGAGDNTPDGCNNTAGAGACPGASLANSYQQVDETNPDDATTFVDIDAVAGSASYNFTNSSTAGIDSYDTISLVHLYSRAREEAAGTTTYGLFLKSASGGTKLKSTTADIGSTTWRTAANAANDTMAGALPSYTDPTTAAAWTPTGTNSVDNIVAGGWMRTTTDVDVSGFWINVEYVDGTAPVVGDSGTERDGDFIIIEQ